MYLYNDKHDFIFLQSHELLIGKPFNLSKLMFLLEGRLLMGRGLVLRCLLAFAAWVQYLHVQYLF